MGESLPASLNDDAKRCNPHSASTADSENAKLTALFCENLRHYLAGHPERMRNILDKGRLY